MFHDFFFKGPFDNPNGLENKRGPLCEVESHANAFAAASSPDGDHGMKPALRAAWRGSPMELVELAEEGAEMLCRDEAGNTALHWAAIGQKPENLAHLISQGHRVWELNNKKQDALSIALEYKDYACARTILDHAGLKERSKDAATPPEYARAKSTRDMLRILKEQISLDKSAKLKKLARLQH